MKNIIERFFKEAPTDELMVSETHDKPKKRKSEEISRKQFILGALAISALLLCFCVYMILDTLTVGAGATIDSFNVAKDEAAEGVYQFFYDKSYEAAEKAHHVSNNVSISIGTLKEEQKLEVLKVSDVTYETPKPKDQNGFEGLIANITGIFDAEVVSWLEVPGNGVFTVNLQAGEFIIDEERQYVLIRVPNPELTEFAIDYENVELLLFEEGGAFKNSAKYGVDKAVEQLQSAELTMMQNVNNNQEFYKRARESTEKMLMNLVKQLNPQLPNLLVEIEFID